VTPTQTGRLKLMLEARVRELSSSLRNHENIAVERTPDVVDNVELAGERDLPCGVWTSVLKSYSWCKQRWTALLVDLFEKS